MTRSGLSQAVEQRDVTIALSTAQLALLAVGAFILLRILRSLRR